MAVLSDVSELKKTKRDEENKKMSECGSVGPSVNGLNVECMVRTNDLGEE